MESNLLACLRNPPALTQFHGEVQACLNDAVKRTTRFEGPGSLVVLGWIFDSESAGTPVDFDQLGSARLPFASLTSKACYLWLELNVRGSSQAKDHTLLNLNINDGIIEDWHRTARACFTHTSRAREIGSLATCSPLTFFKRLRLGADLFNIYSWEGVDAPLLAKAHVLQAAMALERLMSDCIRKSFRASVLMQNWGLMYFTLGHQLPSQALLAELQRENYMYLRLVAHAYNVNPHVLESNSSCGAPSTTLPALAPATAGSEFVRSIRSDESSFPTKPQIARLFLPSVGHDDVEDPNGMLAAQLRKEVQPPMITCGHTQSVQVPAAQSGEPQRIRHRPPVLPVLPHRHPPKKPFKRTEPEGGPNSGRGTPPQTVSQRSHHGHEDSHRSLTTENEESVESQRSSKARRLSQPSKTPPFSGVQIPALDAVRPVKGPESPHTPPHIPTPSSSSSSSSSGCSSSGSSSPVSSSQTSSYASQTPQGGVPKLGLGLGAAKSGMGVPRITALATTVRRMPPSLEPQPMTGDPDEERSVLLARYRNEISPVIPDRLYVSGEVVAADISILRRARITHVLNAAGDTCPNYFPGVFDYLTLVLQDSRLTNEALESVLPASLSFVDQALKRKGVVLIHCREGVSRSATIAVAFLMWREGLNFPSALDRVRRVRAVCNPNTGFTFTLLKFGKRITRLTAGSSDTSTPFERKLCRVTTHHPAAPFIVVLGISLFEPQRGAWMPGGAALRLDPRFYYVLRDDYEVHVWCGSAVPRHMSRVLSKSIDKYIRDIKNFETVPDNGLKVLRHEEGKEDSKFWSLLYPEGPPPENRIARLPHLDTEARIIQAALPQLTVFDVAVWEAQLKARPEADAMPFNFHPPDPGHESPSRDSRLLNIAIGQSRGPMGSLSYRNHVTERGQQSGQTRIPRGPKDNAPSTGRFRLGYGRRSDEDDITPPSARGDGDDGVPRPSIVLPGVHSEADLGNPLSDLVTESLVRMNTAAEATALVGTPPEITSRSDIGVKTGVGADNAYDIGVPYFFVVPELRMGEGLVDEECLQSDRVLLVVKFGQSALLAPHSQETSSEEDMDYGGGGGEGGGAAASGELSTRRRDFRSVTAPAQKRKPPVPLLTRIRYAGSGPEEVDNADANSATHKPPVVEGDESLRKWKTKIWLWEGLKAMLDSDETRESIIDDFCHIHHLDYRNVDVRWELEEEEGDEFTAIVYL